MPVVPRTTGEQKIELRYGPRWSLSGPALMLALFSLVSGLLLLFGLNSTGIFGVLFGPVFGFIGLSFLSIWVFKAYGVEKLGLGPGALRHSFHLGGLSWGSRDLDLAGAPMQVRLRTRGALGFSLEIVCGTRMLIAGSGSTTASRLTPTSLMDIGNRICLQYSDSSGESSSTP